LREIDLEEEKDEGALDQFRERKDEGVALHFLDR
jgi:hypothetical protein